MAPATQLLAAPSPEAPAPLVAVIGLGGVGSHCAHGLVRAGLRNLRLVDFDRVSLSSLNRHAVATRRDVGTPKVEACAQHFREIAPGCAVDARDEMFTTSAASTLLSSVPQRPALVVDCIDDVSTKADLLAHCVGEGLPVISALGSGAKSDPTQMCVAKGLRDIENDPLATKLRKVFSTRNVDLSAVSFVYSSQKVQRSLLPLSAEQRQNPEEYGNVANFRLRVIPVLGTQPAVAGVSLAAQALLELGIGRRFCPRPSPAPRRALIERYLEQLRKREGSRSGGSSRNVDVTIGEAAFLVHEVWHGRSALNTDLAVSGASGLKFAMAKWDPSGPAVAGNLILATEDEIARHSLEDGLYPEETRERVSTALHRAANCLALPSLQALQAERQRSNSIVSALNEPQREPEASSRAPANAGRRGQADDDQARREEEALTAEQLSRSSAFLGPAGHDCVRKAFVVVVGAGAAGSAAASLLVRAGVRRLRLIDDAVVQAGRCHAVAKAADAGIPKAEACRRALCDVLPTTLVEVLVRRFEASAAKDLLGLAAEGARPDIVLDCTGDVSSKVEVLSAAIAHGIRAVSVMAAESAVDPTRMAVAPLSEVHASPVAVLLRRRLAKDGVAAAKFEGVDAVHSQEAGYWLEPPSASGPGQPLLRLSLGLAAAAVALHRLVGEAPPQAAAPGTVSAWKKLRRGLAQREGLDPHSGDLPDVHAVGFVAEQVWRGRSALNRSAGAKPSEAMAGLVLARWDHSRPLDLWNLVLLTEEEALAHAGASAATGSLPGPLLEALCRGSGRCGSGEDGLEQQLRAHYVLKRLRSHVDATGGATAAAAAPRARATERPFAAPAGIPSAWRGILGSARSQAVLATLVAVGGLGVCVAMGRGHSQALLDSLLRSTRRAVRRAPRLSAFDAAAGSVLGAVATTLCPSNLRELLRRRSPQRFGLEVLSRCRSGAAPSRSVGRLLSWSSTADAVPQLAGDDAAAGSGRAGFAGLVGATPLVELRCLSEATGCLVLAKAEFLSPGGCQKDRVAQSIVDEAEASGTLRPGGTICEGTSGSTGISLSLAAAARGYKVHIVMPDDQAAEKVQLLRRFGAHVELVRPASISNPEHYVNVARRRATEICAREGRGAAIFADQFENPANFNAHYRGTGPELWAQCGRQLDAFVMSAGTGGTIAGVARFLKEVAPETRVCLADVQGSSLYNKVARGVLYADEQAEQTVKRHRTDTIAEGIGIDRLTANFARGLAAHNGGLPGVDEAVRVTDQEALEMAHHLLAHEGLFVGSSSAVNCAAAVKVARRLGPYVGRVVATVLCDGGQRHVTKFYSPESWAEFGLTQPPKRERGDLSFVS